MGKKSKMLEAVGKLVDGACEKPEAGVAADEAADKPAVAVVEEPTKEDVAKAEPAQVADDKTTASIERSQAEQSMHPLLALTAPPSSTPGQPGTHAVRNGRITRTSSDRVL